MCSITRSLSGCSVFFIEVGGIPVYYRLFTNIVKNCRLGPSNVNRSSECVTHFQGRSLSTGKLYFILRNNENIVLLRKIKACFPCHFTLQYPPLAGPIRSMMPSALSLARCFSMALAEMPIFPASAAALSFPFSASNSTIFSLLYVSFSLPSFVFSPLY